MLLFQMDECMNLVDKFFPIAAPEDADEEAEESADSGNFVLNMVSLFSHLFNPTFHL